MPAAISFAFVKPSPSGSALGSDPGILMVLNIVALGRNPRNGVGSDDPAGFVPTSVNLPDAPLLVLRVIVADVAAGLIEGLLTVTTPAGRTKTSRPKN